MTGRATGVIVYPMPERVSGPFESYALLVRADGQVRMVHTDGVAYAVTDDKPWQWNDYDRSLCVWSPANLIEVIDQPVDPSDRQPVDLADWVRSFGARLESNFWMIHNWATEVTS